MPWKITPPKWIKHNNDIVRLDNVYVQTYKKYIDKIKPGTILVMSRNGKVKPYNWREMNKK